MSNKNRYQQFCKSQKELPIFYQFWYLDVVCGAANWEVSLFEKGGKVIAVLPYFIKHKGPFTYLTMPDLCKFMGPYIAPQWRHPKHEHQILKKLIEQLPKFSFFNQNCHYTFTDWLPFYWKNFTQSTKYSYIIENLDDLDQVFANFVTDYRNTKLNKANRIVSLSFDHSLEDFFAVSKMSFSRQQKAFPLSYNLVETFDSVLEKHKARKIFFAVDKEERIHSVVYLIWDQHTAYYLVAGDNPELRSSGASIFLVWEAIKFSQKTLGLNCFDFMGSMIPAIEKVRRNFGAQQKPYFEIKKYNSNLFRMLEWTKKWF
jgi:Acetyltransferase (GNAT) domain